MLRRQPRCRFCGSLMQVEVVRYAAPDAAGRRDSWEGVRHYHCPNGCMGGYFDFRSAWPSGRSAGASAGGGRGARLAWGLAGAYAGIGLVVLYGLFMYAIAAIPMGGLPVRVASWVAVTAVFAAIGAMMVAPSRRRAAAIPAAGAVAVAREASPRQAAGARDTGAPGATHS